MNFLSREAILEAVDLTTEDIHVPEWGGYVRVKGLTGSERDRFEADVTQARGKRTVINMTNIRARLVAMAVVDEQGKPLFRPADIEALGKKSGAALDRVFAVAMRLAGMRDEDIAELTENFPPDQSGSSTSN